MMERKNYQRDFAKQRLECRQPEEKTLDLVDRIVTDFCRSAQMQETAPGKQESLAKGKPRHKDFIFLRLYMATNDK